MPSPEQRHLFLRDKAKACSDSPGIYRMLDAAGKILYVGKAKSLTHRIRSYFQSNIEDPKTRALVSKVCDFEVLLTKTEAEALILESILIKKHKPRYNILLRDDKAYPYVLVDEKHSFPKIVYVRRPKKGKQTKIYGPFASSTSLRSALRTLNRIFMLRDCSDLEFSNRSRPCINHQIGICSAPCTGLISPENYKNDLTKAIQALAGQCSTAIEQLKLEMENFSQQTEFEQAAKIRDQIHFLEETVSKKRSNNSAIERSHQEEVNRDIVGWYRKPESAAIAVLFVRGGNLVDSSTFHFDDIEGKTDEEILTQFLCQFYLTQEEMEERESFPMGSFSFPGAEAKTLPDEILLPFALDELELLQQSLSNLGRSVKFLFPKKGVKFEILQLAERNAENAFDERQREKGSIYRVLSELKAKLRLENYPRRMECFDISNLGDSGIVASRVTFIEGKPEKSLYRHYKIRSTSSQNDFASMKEVIERRLLKTLNPEDFEEPPDLIIIDGGKGQLSMATEVVKELNITGIDIVALAKAKSVSPEEAEEELAEGREVARAFERIFKPGRMNPILLAPESPVCHLMQRIRDEAHRFAVEFQRKQRKIL